MKRSKKRILCVIAAAALSFSALPQTAPRLIDPMTACAEDLSTENFKYSVNDGSITITEWKGTDTEAVIPEKIDGIPVTAIGSMAFFGCDKLESITLPGSITTINSNAFCNCTGITEFDIPNGVTSIGTGALSGCTRLTSIVIPDSVKTLGEQVFSSCTNLKTITIPKTLTNIGGSAFRGTAWLDEKQGNGQLVIVNDILVDGTAVSGDVVVEEGVTSICDQAFSYCQTITGITIPASVKSIGTSAFFYCTKLKSVNMKNGVERIGNEAFSECSQLTEINISDSVTDIGASTFKGCSSLKDLSLPGNLKSIGYMAFAMCNSLTDVVIPEGTESIGMYSFVMCTSLNNLTLPASLTSINDRAFMNCPAEMNVRGKAGSYAESFADQKGFSFEATAAIDQVSLTLTDDLGLNFFISGVSTDAEAENYRVVFSGKCEEDGTAVSLYNKSGAYCATANVSANHMNENITAVLERATDTGWEEISKSSYSVNRYLNSVDTSESQALEELVETTKEYGEVSNAYFSGGEMPSVADNSSNYNKSSFVPTKGSSDMISLVLDSKLSARLYIEDLPADATASYGEDVLSAQLGRNGKYFFEVTGIVPTALANDINIEYGTAQYSFKPLSWCYLAAKNNPAGKNKTMADILYQYYKSAYNYKYPNS